MAEIRRVLQSGWLDTEPKTEQSSTRVFLKGIIMVLLLPLRYRADFKTKLFQRGLLESKYSAGIKHLIVFLVPGYDIVNGGILSISSMYEETGKLRDIHGSDVMMCTIPGDPRLPKYTKFKNNNFMYDLADALLLFRSLRSLTIHVPEYCIPQFLRKGRCVLRLIRVVRTHINVLIQNIDLLPSLNYFRELKVFGKVTCTTAHEKYTTSFLSKKLGIPLHRLSVFVSPEKYLRKKFGEKENLMIVSPDYHPRKNEVLSLIESEFPKLRLQVIRGLTYEEYKKIISRAKWALTFGEGLDCYFIETIFSGGIGFSVYNSRFFTEDFRSLRTVYDDYDFLIKDICSDIRDLDDEKAYADYQKEQYDLCHRHYRYEEYLRNLRLFYEGVYTYS